MKNVVNIPLINPGKVYLPSLHVKLLLMKDFVKAMEQTGLGFKYVRQILPTIIDAKIKDQSLQDLKYEKRSKMGISLVI